MRFCYTMTPTSPPLISTIALENWIAVHKQQETEWRSGTWSWPHCLISNLPVGITLFPADHVSHNLRRPFSLRFRPRQRNVPIRDDCSGQQRRLGRKVLGVCCTVGPWTMDVIIYWWSTGTYGKGRIWKEPKEKQKWTESRNELKEIISTIIENRLMAHTLILKTQELSCNKAKHNWSSVSQTLFWKTNASRAIFFFTSDLF